MKALIMPPASLCFAWLLLVAVVVSGCDPLGACDDAAARKVYFEKNTGQPAYEGQALMQVSCGNSGFCHSEAAVGKSRYGVPAGLDFDMGIATDCPSGPQCAKLARGQDIVVGHAHSIYHQVARGWMPPGAVGATIASQGQMAHQYVDASGNPLPNVKSAQGTDDLRNWLACGSPVVERSKTPSASQQGGELCNDGSETVGDCIVAEPVTTLSATWPSIYQMIIAPSCTACHDAANSYGSNLDLSSQQTAYDALVGASGTGVTAMGPSCGTTGEKLVDPGSPNTSLLYTKVVGTQDCGLSMPYGTTLPSNLTDVIAMWIQNGALPN